jgi:hypothetical protein
VPVSARERAVLEPSWTCTATRSSADADADAEFRLQPGDSVEQLLAEPSASMGPHPGDDRGQVDRSAGVDLQHRAAQPQGLDPAGEGGPDLGSQLVVDVAGMAGRGPCGEAAFDLAGRAAAEHLDQGGVQGQQARAASGPRLASSTAAGSAPATAYSTS